MLPKLSAIVRIYSLFALTCSCFDNPLARTPESSLTNDGNIYLNPPLNNYLSDLKTLQMRSVPGDRVQSKGSKEVVFKETGPNEKNFVLDIADKSNPNWGASFTFHKGTQIGNEKSFIKPMILIDVRWKDRNLPNFPINLSEEHDKNYRQHILPAFQLLSEGVTLLSYPPLSRLVNKIFSQTNIPNLKLDKDLLEETVEHFKGTDKSSKKTCYLYVYKGPKGDVHQINFKVPNKPLYSLRTFFLIPFPWINKDKCIDIRIGASAKYINASHYFKITHKHKICSTPDADSQHPLEPNDTRSLESFQKSGWIIYNDGGLYHSGQVQYEANSISFCSTDLKANQRKISFKASLFGIYTKLSQISETVECQDMELESTYRTSY